MAKIYIAHHSGDIEYVRELSVYLQEHGHDVFFADDDLRPGQMWENELSAALRSSDALIAVISQQSADSKWMLTETGAAMGYFTERGRPLVIPVVLDGAELPPPLRRVQALFAAGKTVQDVANELDRALDSQIGRIAAREDERREAIKKVETTAATYIQASLKNLKAREDGYRRVAYFWYTLALLSLIGGLAFGIWRAIVLNNSDATPSWESLTQLAIITVLVVGVLGALSRFAFLLGKAFMVESLRNSDRMHAISFGEFYLNAFGDKAEWTEVKEAFQHWNIDKGSTFIDQEAKDVDPQILQTALDIAKAISGAKP
jgi:hypothetical protein